MSSMIPRTASQIGERIIGRDPRCSWGGLRTHSGRPQWTHSIGSWHFPHLLIGQEIVGGIASSFRCGPGGAFESPDQRAGLGRRDRHW